MTTYYYIPEMMSDITEYLTENYTREELSEKLSNREEFEEELRDDLWVCDSVTGNASGSYFCNTYKAEEAIAHNWDILREALEEFGCFDCNPIEKGAEWCDVTIRCYLLGDAIRETLDAIGVMMEV